MSEVLHRSLNEVQQIAKDKGLVAIIPEANELQLDLDNPPYVINGNVLKCLWNKGVEIQDTLKTISPGGNKHIYVRVSKDMTAMERIAIQACLGSDPVREVLSVLRVEAWDCPSALFETPEWADKVQKWRDKFKHYIRREV